MHPLHTGSPGVAAGEVGRQNRQPLVGVFFILDPLLFLDVLRKLLLHEPRKIVIDISRAGFHHHVPPAEGAEAAVLSLQLDDAANTEYSN